MKSVGGDEEVADAESSGGFLGEDHAKVVGPRREQWTFENAVGQVEPSRKEISML